MKRTLIRIFAVVLVIVLLSGCQPAQPLDETAPLANYTAIVHNTAYYDNFQFNAYYNPDGAAEHLPNQGLYGSGNAYILRYNGLYYMYMGTSNMGNSALPCWQSEDLMHWEPVDNGINQKGVIAEDLRLDFTFPPCVRQYNGTFYMYLYIKNDLITQGNYILKASSPIGPFEFVTDTTGEPICYTIDDTGLNIDCDIFIDDNEDVYFMSGHVDPENYFVGIRAFKMPTMDSVSYDDASWINIAGSNVGGWTEGNGIFKRNGNYYLMYTGSDILKPGYLTHYSVANSDAWKAAFGTEQKGWVTGFEEGLDWPMGCETQETFYALGHATSILGPDMDGLYYHYFSVNGVGPNCSFAIDRLIFNGTGMDTAQTQYHSVAPKRPAIYSYDPVSDNIFSSENGKLLSNSSSGETFTAEFNFVGPDVKCVVGYVDAQNYIYVKTNLSSKEIGLYRVENGTETKVASGSILRDYDAPGLLQTVRIAYRDGKADVYFDDLLKIENTALSIPAGRIGYLYEGSFEAGYTACSNVAKGLSDAIEPKQSYINIGAESYLPTGIYDGHGSSFTSGNGFSLVDTTEYGGKYVGLGKMQLSSKADQASFLVNFDESGTYSLQLTFNRDYAGQKIGVRVDGGAMQIFEIPKIEPGDNSPIVKASIGLICAEKGVREITFYGRDEVVAFHCFTFVKSAEKTAYQAALDAAPAAGMEQMTPWVFEKLEGDEAASLHSPVGQRGLVYFGDPNLTDYTVECDFRINTESEQTAGFIIHSARFSNSAYVTEEYQNVQGYYVAINQNTIKLEKLNYTHSNLSAYTESFPFAVGKWNHIKITVSSNSITVNIKDAVGQNTFFRFTDSMLLEGGRFGLFSNGGDISFANLTITE